MCSLFLQLSYQDGIELSRGRTNRLIKTLQEFDHKNTEGQSLRRAETFITSTNRLSVDVGLRPKSQEILSSETTDKEEAKLEGYVSNITQQKTKNNSLEHTTSSRFSMMNEYDSD